MFVRVNDNPEYFGELSLLPFPVGITRYAHSYDHAHGICLYPSDVSI